MTTKNKEKIVAITLLLYVISMGVMFYEVNEYIHKKDRRLLWEINESVKDAFNGRRRVIDVAYSGYDVSFERMDVPDLQQISSLLGKENPYEGIQKMYRTKYKASEWANSHANEDGWELCVVEWTSNMYITDTDVEDRMVLSYRWLFPYAVGYYYNDSPYYGYSYLPSVQAAVDEAYEFFTSDEKSSLLEDYYKGSVNDIWSRIEENEYYFCGEDEKPCTSYLYLGEIDGENHMVTYMYNDYYRVYVATTPILKTFSVKKRPWNPDIKEKNKLYRNWSIGLSALMFCILIPTAVLINRDKKRSRENLYERMKRLCNPSNFMKNYNKDKLEIANDIYKRLLTINENDTEALDSLQIEAMDKLGITFVYKEEISEMKKVVNPKRFMKPYNPEKLDIANALYSSLNKDKLSYNEFCEIKEKAKQL